MIVLEYFEKSNFEQLINWVNTEELLMNWSGALFSFPLTMESMEWYIQDVNKLPDSEAYVYRAVETETGEVIGHISLGGISLKNKSARISRVLIGSEAARGKGYCRQMVEAVLKIGFEELKLHRISLGVYDFNTAAIHCYKKAGMVTEGIFRDCLLFNGRWWSLVEMSMLEEEWRKLCQS